MGCGHDKIHRNTFTWKDPRTRSKFPGDLVHTNLCGSIHVPSLGGAIFFSLFKDDATGYCVVECLRTKLDTFDSFCLRLSRLKGETGHTLKVFRRDNRTEFTSHKFTAFLEVEGIRQELTIVYIAEQNGILERDNRTIIEVAQSITHASNLNVNF